MKTPRYLLDTDIIVCLRRGRPARVQERFLSLKPGEAVISLITYGELLFGIAKRAIGENPMRHLMELIELIHVQAVPLEAAQVYGTVRADLERNGQIIGCNDLWIAAHAIAAELTLVTNNIREFKRVRGLKIESWNE